MHPIIFKDNIEKALKNLKRALQRYGMGKELRKRRAYMKPSERRQKKDAEARRRLHKNLKKRFLRDGY